MRTYRVAHKASAYMHSKKPDNLKLVFVFTGGSQALRKCMAASLVLDYPWGWKYRKRVSVSIYEYRTYCEVGLSIVPNYCIHRQLVHSLELHWFTMATFYCRPCQASSLWLLQFTMDTQLGRERLLCHYCAVCKHTPDAHAAQQSKIVNQKSYHAECTQWPPHQ